MSGIQAVGAEVSSAEEKALPPPIVVRRADAPVPDTIRMETHDLSVFYGGSQVLHSVSLPVPDRAVTALIGPSGCGKSTFLRCLNRMNDIIPNTRVEGQVLLDGEDIYASSRNVVALRLRVGSLGQSFMNNPG